MNSTYRRRYHLLDSAWSYTRWLHKLNSGMVHLKVDGKGEIWLLPGDNWQDVLFCLTGLPNQQPEDPHR